MNIKNVLILVFLVLFSTGCSKPDDDTNNNSNTTSEKKIKKVESTKNGLVIESTSFQYNALGYISKMIVSDGVEVNETVFNYDASNIMISWNLKKYYIPTPNNITEQINSLSYNNGLINSICIDRKYTYSGGVSKSVDKIDFAYSGSGLTSIKHYNDRSNNYNESVCSDLKSISNEELFEYANGNLKRYEAGNSIFSSTYNVIEHDASVNYLSSIKPDAFRYAMENKVAVNNLKKVSVFNSSDKKQIATVEFENTLDKDNNLEKAVERYYPIGKTTPTVVTVINYTYY